MAVNKQMCDTSLYAENIIFHLHISEHPSVSNPDGLDGK
jgi:hypothetical protein